MKRVLIILDGLGDEPIAELGNRTPLEAAVAPNLQRIAQDGEIGTVATTFDGYPVESMVCIMGLLGYAPQEFYPAGRAGFEAAAQGIELNDSDLILRCNTVTVDRDRQRLADFTGGMITDSAASGLIRGIKTPSPKWELYSGQSYRNILIVRDAGIDPRSLKCREPHMHIGGDVEDLLPTALDSQAEGVASDLRDFLRGTQSQIASADQEEGCAANMLWVWSPSQKAVWPTFTSRTGWTAAVVGGLDFLKGIALAAGMNWQDVPGATGYTDTDYAAKARYALDHLATHDFVLVHINATDEAAHQRDWNAKIDAIQKADSVVIGPILQELERTYGGEFKIAVCGDHTTRCSDGKHTADLVPFAAYPSRTEPGAELLSEANSRLTAEPISSLNFLGSVF